MSLLLLTILIVTGDPMMPGVWGESCGESTMSQLRELSRMQVCVLFQAAQMLHSWSIVEFNRKFRALVSPMISRGSHQR